MDEAELIRLRAIIAAIRAYSTVFNSHEKYAEFDERAMRLREDEWETRPR